MARGMKSTRKPTVDVTSHRPKKSKLDLDDRIDSSSEEDEDVREPPLQEEEEEEEKEALAVKQVRLAREYLENIDGNSDESSSEDESDDDDDRDALSRKLQRERLRRQGTLQRFLAEKTQKHVAAISESMENSTEASAWIESGNVSLLRGHDLTPTSVALSHTADRAISGSKDHSVFLWDVENQTRLATLQPRWTADSEADRTPGQVLSVALSDDGKFGVTGKRDGTISVFDIRTQNVVKEFTGAKEAITSLAFQSQTNQLFSACEDRCIRYYNLDEMMVMETLYGHQFGATCIDCYQKERPVSVARDRTLRAWKIEEDSHLIYRGGARLQSAQSVSMIKDDWFLTGHDDGHLCFWMSGKKKAVATIDEAHGAGNEIVSVSAVRGSDLAATGSCDGSLRLWHARSGSTMDERGLDPLGSIPLRGFINSIAFENKARFCIAAVGQEHRLGRWSRIKGAKNRIAIVTLRSDLLDDN